MSDKPRKKLILVVHGIGEQVPGECLGLLTSSMPVQQGTETSYDIDWLPEETGAQTDEVDFQAQGKSRRAGQTRVPHLFACHSRHMKSPENDNIFAEVYWSDVVVTGQQAFDILVSLVRVILGLGHIVRESAKVSYNRHPVMRRLSNAAIYLIHGPIAAINTVLLFGAILGMSMRSVIDPMTQQQFHWLMLMTLPFAVYSAYRWRRTKSYLWRSYWCWLLVISFVLTASAVIYADMASQMPLLRDIAIEIQYDSLRFICQDLTPVESIECKRELRGYYFFGVLLLLAQQLIWLLTVAIMTVILIFHMGLWIAVRLRKSRRKVPSLVPLALSAMVLFWIIILCCIWAVGYYIDARFIGNFNMFQVAFFLVYVNWGFALILVIVVLLILAVPYQRWANTVTKDTYFTRKPGSTVELPNPPPRLIVPNFAAVVTMLCPPVLLALAIISLLRDFQIAFDEVGLMNHTANWASHNFNRLLIVSAALGVGLYWMRDQLRVGIGLGSDIISYFLAPGYDPNASETVFPIRNRIERRFIAVARRMIAWHQPDEVIIIAHSQGTVVALDVLRNKKIPALIGQGVPWKLITMGSPFTHIYGEYFPRQFVVPGQARTGLASWTNIFRVDDFVGTHIRTKHDLKKPSWPEECPVSANGHTHYWVDSEVVEILTKKIFD